MEPGGWLSILILIVHVVPAVFWVGSSAVIARGLPQVPNSLGWAQLGSGSVTILLGLLLWGVFHAHRYGHAEQVLTFVLLASVTALLLQQIVTWPARRHGRALPRVERVAAVLLVLATAAVVTVRFVG